MKNSKANTNQEVIYVFDEEINFFRDFTKRKNINWPLEQQKNNILIINSSIVGYIVTPLREILLKPKYKEINFNHILRMHLYLYGFHENDDSKLLNVSNIKDDVDMANMFLDNLEKQLLDGVFRNYQKEDQTTNAIVGKVDFTKTLLNIKKNKKKPVATTIRKLTTNNVINKLIKGALNKLTNHSEYALRANDALYFFQDVTDPVTEHGSYYLNQIVFNSVNESYRETVNYAAMIIDYTDYSDFGDNTGVQSFLINFDVLFEAFIVKVTTETSTYNKFSTWDKKEKLTVNNQSLYDLRYQPDILFEFDSASILNNFKPYAYGVLDVKNKAYNVFKNADIYQVFVYAKALNSKKAILIYPSFSEKNTEKIFLDHELFDPSVVHAEYINIAKSSGQDFLQSIEMFRKKLMNTLLR